MKLIHISHARADYIRSQGRPLVTSLAGGHVKGNVEFHLLDGDVAHCSSCNAEFESVKADDPIELEMAKLAA